jgi:hypothetical protein
MAQRNLIVDLQGSLHLFVHPTQAPNSSTQLKHPTQAPNSSTQLKHPTRIQQTRIQQN